MIVVGESLKHGGQGLFTKQFIEKSTQILCEPALISVRRPSFTQDKTLYSNLEKYPEFKNEILKQFKNLALTDQKEIVQLCNNYRKPGAKINIFDILRTNFFLSPDSYSVLGILSSRMNHSCNKANAYCHVTKTTLTVISIADIPAGKEIFIDYSPVTLLALLPQVIRRAKLTWKFNFHCVCAFCTKDQDICFAFEMAKYHELKFISENFGEPPEIRFLAAKACIELCYVMYQKVRATKAVKPFVAFNIVHHILSCEII